MSVVPPKPECYKPLHDITAKVKREMKRNPDEVIEVSFAIEDNSPLFIRLLWNGFTRDGRAMEVSIAHPSFCYNGQLNPVLLAEYFNQLIDHTLEQVAQTQENTNVS